MFTAPMNAGSEMSRVAMITAPGSSGPSATGTAGGRLPSSMPRRPRGIDFRRSRDAQALDRFGFVDALTLAHSCYILSATQFMSITKIRKTHRSGSRPKRPSTKRAILDRARELIERDGLDDFTTWKLASEVPISEPAIFYHFRDRETLLLHVALTIVTEEFQRLVQAAMSARDVRSAMAAVVHERVRFYEDRPDALELVHFWAFPRLTPELRQEASAKVEGVWDAIENKASRGRPTSRRGRASPLRLQIMSAWVASDGLALLQLRVGRGHVLAPGGMKPILDRVARFAADAVESPGG